MKKINIRRIYYLIRHKYMTLNNVVVVVALVIGAGWVWGSVSVMQRNYDLQKELTYKRNQLQLAELETANLQLQNRYYQTREYKELAVRENLGLVSPGESVLILPDNSAAVKLADQASEPVVTVPTEDLSNFQQWINFLFGSRSNSSS